MVELDRFALEHVHKVLIASTSLLLEIDKRLRCCHYESDEFVKYINTMDRIFDTIEEKYNEDIALALVAMFINKVPATLKLNDEIIIKSLSARNCAFTKIASFYKIIDEDDRTLIPDIPIKYLRLGIIESCQR